MSDGLSSRAVADEHGSVEPREIDHLFGSGIIVAVGAVVLDERGRILLVRHVPERRGYWRDRWICPGGRLTRGESILIGVIREVREETGLLIRPRRLLPPFERIVTDHTGTRLHVIYIDYVADAAENQVRPASDIGEYTWVTPADLGRVWAECHEDTRRLLRLAGFRPAPATERASP